MPRIAAPTLAEHHEMRRAALVAASRDLLASGGVGAVTPAGVAARAGLARTSVYQYFPSTDALVAAAVAATFADVHAELAAAVSQAGEPRARVRAYVRHALALATRHHTAFRELPAEPAPELLARLRDVHTAMLAPLRAAVEELGVAEPALLTSLVFGAVSAAAESVDRGADLDAAADATVAFVDAGLVAAPTA